MPEQSENPYHPPEKPSSSAQGRPPKAGSMFAAGCLSLIAFVVVWIVTCFGGAFGFLSFRRPNGVLQDDEFIFWMIFLASVACSLVAA